MFNGQLNDSKIFFFQLSFSCRETERPLLVPLAEMKRSRVILLTLTLSAVRRRQVVTGLWFSWGRKPLLTLPGRHHYWLQAISPASLQGM